MLKPIEYLKAGVRVAPIKKGGVHPPFDNWQDKEFKARDFRPEHSIAIITGRPARNPIVDIDLDHELTIRLASEILPSTSCIFGRLSAPKSHWLYRSNGPTHKWKVNGIGMLVELRSKGGVTLAPPSIHKDSGEERTWDECKPKQIQVVEYKELKRACNVLASAALLASCWPTVGMRHDYALGVGGWFAKEMDLTTDQVVRIVRKMMTCVVDEEPDDRIRAAKESAEKHYAGNNVSAFNTLEPIIGKPHAITLRQWSSRPTKGGKPVRGSSQTSESSVDDDGSGADSIRSTSDGVSEALERLGVKVRCNIRTMGSEYNIDNEALGQKLRNPPKNEWIEDSDDLQAVLMVTTETTMTFGAGKTLRPAAFADRKWQNGTLFARSEHHVDPFRVYLESLPKWDGKDRLFDLVKTIWELAYPEEEDFACWAMASRLIAAVDRTFNPGCVADEMIILQSLREGIMKSTSIGLMFPPDNKVELRRSVWLHEGLKLDVFDPRQPLEEIGQAVFVEASEMQGRKKADVDRLKSWISRRRDRHRFAYARVPVNLPRRFVIFGTANEVECLPSDMGDGRRYLPIALKPRMDGFQARDWFHDNREQLWAEALFHHNDGIQHFLPKDGMIAEQHKTAVARHRGGAETAEHAAEKVLAKAEERVSNPYVVFSSDGKQCIRSSDIIDLGAECGFGKGDMHLVRKGLLLKGWHPGGLKRITGQVCRVWEKD